MMTLNTRQKDWLFRSFLGLVFVYAAVEIGIIVSMLWDGNIGRLELALAALNGTGLALTFRLYRDLVRVTFVRPPEGSKDPAFLVSGGQLAGYFEWRVSALQRCKKLDLPEACDQVTGDLLRSTLRLVESILKLCVGSQRFEISIFSNVQHPEIICYYDSDRNTRPHSQTNRDKDPDYYRNKRYEVVELLQQPSDKLHVVSRTQVDEDYSFSSKQQRRDVRSTALWSISFDQPLALVLASDRDGAFVEDDDRLLALVATAGTAVRAELELRKRLPVKEDGQRDDALCKEV